MSGQRLQESDLADIRQELLELRNTVEGARHNAKRAVKKANENSERLDQREERDRRLVEEIAELRDRTRLLQAIHQATALKKDQRVAVLVQTLYNKALSHSNGNGKKPVATADVQTYVDALGGDVDRTYFYRDARAAEEMVGDTDVLQLVEEPRNSKQNTRLILNLENGDLPDLISRTEIQSPENRRRA